MYKVPIKGRFLKKPIPETPSLAGSIDSVIKTTEELNALKSQIVEQVDTKIQEVDKIAQEATRTSQEAKNTVYDTKQEVKNILSSVKKGDKGESPTKDELVSLIKPLIPEPIKPDKPEVIDRGKLIKDVLKALPENKASLKIIQEKFEIDPMSVIDKIMSLPEGKFKLKSSQVDGLDQTIRAFQSQLGRGYLHGGGLNQTDADKRYIIGDGVRKITVGLVAPTNPAIGDLWVDSS